MLLATLPADEQYENGRQQPVPHPDPDGLGDDWRKEKIDLYRAGGQRPDTPNDPKAEDGQNGRHDRYE